MNSIFDMDKPFWKWLGKIPELVLLSFFWFICCIPVITVIPASCALFDAVSRNTLTDTKGSFTRFFRSFIRELKRGIPLTLLWIVIVAVIAYGDFILRYGVESETIPAFFALFYRIMLVMPAGFLCWLVPLQSRYFLTFGNLHINAMKFSIGRLPYTALMVLIDVIAIVVVTIHPALYPLIVVLPSLICVFHGKLVEKAFMQAFPDNYVDGVLVTTEEEREAALRIAAAKQAELESEE